MTILHPQKQVIRYQFFFNLIIEIALSTIACLIMFYSNWHHYIIVIVLFFCSTFINLWQAWWHYKTSTMTIRNDIIIISKGNFFKRHAYIPIQKIYMLYVKHNYFMEHQNITSLEIRTLAKNYELVGLSILDTQYLIDYFDEAKKNE